MARDTVTGSAGCHAVSHRRPGVSWRFPSQTGGHRLVRHRCDLKLEIRKEHNMVDHMSGMPGSEDTKTKIENERNDQSTLQSHKILVTCL